MDVTEALLDSWDRQCRIVNAVASLVTESNRHAKPSEDGWPLDHQLAHILEVRKYWLGQLSPANGELVGSAFLAAWDRPVDDLGAIRTLLAKSDSVVRTAVAEAIAVGGAPAGGYDNPVLFLQHMIWHEGWHVGLIFLALRLAGEEPSEEWSEEHVWGEWRTEEW